VMMSLPGMAKDETYYCYSPDNIYVYTETYKQGSNPVFINPTNKCQTVVYMNHLEIPKNVHDKFQNILLERLKLINSQDRSRISFPVFNAETNQILKNFIDSSKAEIEEHNDFRLGITKEIKRKKNLERVPELEKSFAAKCKTHKKGSDQYVDCLIEEEKIFIAAEKIRAKELEVKLSKMSADDRRAYNCSEKFKFKLGSDKFKDCVFKIYQAELELEKLELQRQLLKANIELAKANADRQDTVAKAQVETAKMQALAAQQQANTARTAETLDLLELSLRLLAPPPAAQNRNLQCTSSNVGGIPRVNCF